MFNYILRKIVGTQNERQLGKLAPIAEAVNSLEEQIGKLTDSQLCAKTDTFKKRIRERIGGLE